MRADLGAEAAGAARVPVFILCGGLGTRLRAVEVRPKAVIPVAGLPFLTYTLRLLHLQGFRRIHLLLGVGADEIAAVFRGPGIEYSREESARGTGGALGLARDRAEDRNLILNGDSYSEAIYLQLLVAHEQHGDEAFRSLTLLAVHQEDCAEYGSLEIAPDGHVTAFRERGEAGPGWINAGVYAAGGEFFRALPEGRFNLEKRVLPDLARRGLLRVLPQRFFFRDIGTPERLAKAQEEFRWVRRRMEHEALGAGGSSAADRHRDPVRDAGVGGGAS